VFKHKIGTTAIQFCYQDHPSEPIKLSPGKYRLTLTAGASGSKESITYFAIRVGRAKKFEVAIENKGKQTEDTSQDSGD